jgi:phthalate 4,5-dioxygenase oxygenase subunit
MLKDEENRLLTQVGPGTPMGALLRAHWIPGFLSKEVVADGDPLRVRLLGEDLVAFRDSDGNLGLLGAHCPHRGADLFLGRNEDRGLACVYHGWKFDVTGRCVLMPNEPPESTFKERVRATAYRVTERNGMAWVYMGDSETPPGLPALGWNLVPESHSIVDKRFQDCNWAQALEGGIDHTHTGFLHRTSKPVLRAKDSDPAKEKEKWARRLISPRFETLDTDFGISIAARRPRDEDKYDWHITHFLMPFYTVLNGADPAMGHAWVPMDDEHTVSWSMTWSRSGPISDEVRDRLGVGQYIHAGQSQFLPRTTAPEGAWRPIGRRENDWLLDRDAARTERFMGVPFFWLQDQAVQESMGPIFDRSKERLGSSDAGIIRVRRRWLKDVRALQDGEQPISAQRPDSYHVYGTEVVLPQDVDWVEGARSKIWPEEAKGEGVLAGTAAGPSQDGGY